MEGEGEVHRDVFLLAHHHGPGAAGGVVIGVVGLPAASEGAVHARPLHPIVGAFGRSGHPGGASPAGKFAHPAADLDRIGGHHLAGWTPVVEEHAAGVAFGEFEGPEIDPGPAAALLIDAELCLSAQVADRVMCIGAALRQGLIGDVDGIAAAPLDGRRPADGGGGLFSCATGLAGRAGDEWIVAEGIDGLGVGKAGAGISPGAFLPVGSAAAHPILTRAFEGAVVVDNDLPPLRIPLTRGHHIGAGILQHRNEERKYESLREHIFHRAVETSALPGPDVEVFVVVASVALPEGDVAVGHATGESPFADAADETGLLPSRIVRLEGIVGWLTVRAEHGRGQFLERIAVGDDAAGGVAFELPLFLQLLAEPVHIRLVPGVIGEVCVEREIQGAAARVDAGHGNALVDGGAPFQAGAECVADRAEVPGAGNVLRTEACVQRQAQQQEGQEGAVHFFLRILSTSMMNTSRPDRPMARQSAPKSLISLVR